MVKWDQVTLPYEHGGLSIRLPGLMNTTLGMKIIWRMITRKESWWKKALATKYLNQTRTKLLTYIIHVRPCTQVWKLVKKIIPSIRNHISKTPGNGKSVAIWDDRIMGKEPLNLQQDLLVIQKWMAERGFNTLHSVSAWDQQPWHEWKIPTIPLNLKGHWEKLKHDLKGAVPINIEEEDNYVWDPNGGRYTAK